MPSKTTALLTGGALLAGTTTASLALAPRAGAMTLLVTNANDDGPGSLRQAMLDAEANPGADTIIFDPSVSGTITLGSSLPMISQDLTVLGPGRDQLTIDGSRRYAGFAQDLASLRPAPAPISLTISGLHLDGMRGSSIPLSVGAITVLTGDLTVRDTIVTDSAADGDRGTYCFGAVVAGAVLDRESLKLTSATFERVAVVDNVASAYYSICSSISSVADTITISDSDVSRNTATVAAGPVLFGTRITISSSTFTGNVATQGYGGLVVAGKDTTITGSMISGNRAATSAGVFCYDFGDTELDSITITDTTMSSNTSLYGPVNVLVSNAIRLTRATVVGNTTAVEPARTAAVDPAYLLSAALIVTSDTTIESSTIADNSGTGLLIEDRGDGSTPPAGPARSANPILGRLRGSRSTGAVVPPDVHVDVQVRHSTIAGNSVSGIGYFLYGADPGVELTDPTLLTLDHALVAGNGGATPVDVDMPFTSRYSLVQTPTAAFDDLGGTIVGADPELQPLAWYSWFGAVRPIPFGSPAWNAGDPTFSPPPSTDQTGAPRVIEIIDMGAYEVQERLQLPKFAG